MKKGEFNDVFRYELDDENQRLTYILTEHVDHLVGAECSPDTN
jgi:hypothetical protein